MVWTSFVNEMVYDPMRARALVKVLAVNAHLCKVPAQCYAMPVKKKKVQRG